MKATTTTLPTDVGTFLYCGTRGDRPASVRDLATLRSAEIVRVRRNASGHLMYVGLDFFHHPEQAVGVWLPIDEEYAAVFEAAKRAMAAHLAPSVAKVFEGWWRESLTEEQVLHHLANPYKGDDDKAASKQVFDQAVAQGLVEQDGDGQWRLCKAQGG